ncbi:hypothetical protein [Alloactinosynnema sp. L-07]|uniref:hypothetical protein n=1 Tax=Alloactinosynnema sp. L-07 TaxID=1653480 RepID=UPI00065F0487|nr:hypothetical protein [Alloactinosynnema sp. L-07]CRK62244.1 hypothetical protein [Alloactinosynnema sp. L-07]
MTWAVQATAKTVPARWTATFKTAGPDHRTTPLRAGSTPRCELLRQGSRDRRPRALRSLPTKLDLLVDRAASHVSLLGDQAIGSATVAFAKNLGAYAPLDGDHATVITRPGDRRERADHWHEEGRRLRRPHPPRHRVRPGRQAFIVAGDIDDVHKARLEISNLPATLSIDADTAGARSRTRRARSSAARTSPTPTPDRPDLFGTVLAVPSTVELNYDLGDKPRLRYTASSRIPRIELFAAPGHVEQLRPLEDHYLSAATVNVPTGIDILVDLPAKHLQGTLTDVLDGVTAVARFPVGAATGPRSPSSPESRRSSTRLGRREPAVPRRQRAVGGRPACRDQPREHDRATGLHAAVHYRQSTGDLDASVSVRKLSHIEYSRTEQGNQTFRLDVDTAGAPVFVDADVVLGADDTRYAVSGRIDNLPSTIRVDVADGKITYAADRNIGLALNVAFGKAAALNGLGAPLFDNGVAAVARGCDDGAGCTRDESPFCTAFARCFGVVGTVNCLACRPASWST